MMRRVFVALPDPSSSSERRRAPAVAVAARRGLDDVCGVAREDFVLGARQVVLGQQADGVEEERAEFVVEVFRQEEFPRGGQAAPHVSGQPLVRLAAREGVDAEAPARLCVRRTRHLQVSFVTSDFFDAATAMPLRACTLKRSSAPRLARPPLVLRACHDSASCLTSTCGGVAFSSRPLPTMRSRAMKEQAEEIARKMAETRAATLALFDCARRGLARKPRLRLPPRHLASRAHRRLRGLLAAAKGAASPARRTLRARLRPHPDAARRVEGPAHAPRDGRISRARARALAPQSRRGGLRLATRCSAGLRLRSRPRTRAPASGDARLPPPPARPVEEDAARRARRRRHSDASPSTAEASPSTRAAHGHVPAGPFGWAPCGTRSPTTTNFPRTRFSFPPSRSPPAHDQREYARFVAEGGYERREFWSEEGWDGASAKTGSARSTGGAKARALARADDVR